MNQVSIIVKQKLVSPGDSVKVRLFNNHIIEGRVAVIYESMEGVRVRVVSNDFV